MGNLNKVFRVFVGPENGQSNRHALFIGEEVSMNYLLSHRLRTLSVEKCVRFAWSLLSRATFLLMFPLAYCYVLFLEKSSDRQHRVGTIPLSSIGGAIRFDAFRRRTQGQSHSVKFLFIPGYEPVINPYFYGLMKRHVDVVESPVLRFLLTSLVRLPNRFRLSTELEFMGYDEVGRYPPVQWFEEQDISRGRAVLRDLGLTDENAWYVCFFARDNAYNETYNSGDERRNNLAYHSSRNSDIGDYEEAMQFVLDQGGYVIRMGMIVSKPVGLRHPRLIDYPYSKFRSDFADIYLICHAKFVIGCGSGIVCLSSMVDMPLGCVNTVPLSLGYGRRNLVLIPKMIKSSITGRFLSIAEWQRLVDRSGSTNIIVEAGMMAEHGLSYVDNSPEDILMVTKTMYEKFVATQEGYAECLGRTAEVWAEFLQRHPELLADTMTGEPHYV